MDRDQLEALKRQIEEEYRLDMAAIERLQRRFSGQTAGSMAVQAAVAAPLKLETSISAAPKSDKTSVAQDDITASLRTMFSSVK